MEEIIMKKSFLLFILLLIISVVLIAQPSNNEQQIVGTWISDFDGSDLVFNSDGSISGGRLFGQNLLKYAAIGDKMVLICVDGTFLVNFLISSDGNILIIIHNSNGFSYRKKY
jgi:hypothetical protein